MIDFPCENKRTEENKKKKKTLESFISERARRPDLQSKQDKKK